MCCPSQIVHVSLFKVHLTLVIHVLSPACLSTNIIIYPQLNKHLFAISCVLVFNYTQEDIKFIKTES